MNSHVPRGETIHYHLQSYEQCLQWLLTAVKLQCCCSWCPNQHKRRCIGLSNTAVPMLRTPSKEVKLPLPRFSRAGANTTKTLHCIARSPSMRVIEEDEVSFARLSCSCLCPHRLITSLDAGTSISSKLYPQIEELQVPRQKCRIHFPSRDSPESAISARKHNAAKTPQSAWLVCWLIIEIIGKDLMRNRPHDCVGNVR